jgi:hypothetical protein
MTDEDFQAKFNSHLRRNVVFTYLGIKYNVSLNLTMQHIASIKILEGEDHMDDAKWIAIKKYLQDEGYFDL